MGRYFTRGRNAVVTNPTADLSFKSSFYEQVVEHVFMSEVLQEVWYRFKMAAEVLHSEIDASGFDVVIECNGVLRHVQLKTSRPGGKASSQKVNLILASKPRGCVVWILRDDDRPDCRMKLSYLLFDLACHEPLGSTTYKTAKHTKGNAQGEKLERPGIKVVPKRLFEAVTITQLAQQLFDLPPC